MPSKIPDRDLGEGFPGDEQRHSIDIEYVWFAVDADPATSRCACKRMRIPLASPHALRLPGVLGCNSFAAIKRLAKVHDPRVQAQA
jgi:hypothetical protein